MKYHTSARVREEISAIAAEVTINYTATPPWITTALLGTSKPRHAVTNLKAMDFSLNGEERGRLRFSIP